MGQGICLFAGIKLVSNGLREIVTLTEVHNVPPKPRIPFAQRTGKEDAIKTESLAVLANSENVELRRAATQILVERFLNHNSGSLKSRLAKDLKSTDPEKKHQAELARRLLEAHSLRFSLEGDGVRDRWSWITAAGGNGALRAIERAEELGVGERDLRRRRREAVVINEGDRPISQEDVYMRDADGRMSMEQ
jgi:hypothetical protein